MASATFVFLLLGHALGDFAWQSQSVVEGKLADRAATRLQALGQHALMLLVAHTLALMPLWYFGAARVWQWLWILPALVGVHILVDLLKSAFERWRGATLTTFCIDQALHLVALLFAASFAQQQAEVATIQASVVRLALTAAAYLLCTLGGSAIVRLVLSSRQPDGASTGSGDALRMGHTIGVLERALGLTFVLLDAWVGLAGIIAAKSIARFKDLEDRPFGEYFLVGTLTSLLVTVAFGAVARHWLSLLQ